MLKYETIKPSVYLEPTVISHLVARPSGQKTLADWQRASRQLWEDYADRFEFVISNLVRNEIDRGDAIPAKQRLEIISLLPVLEISEDAIILAEKLLDTGAVPINSGPDAQHIAIATVHNIEYLVSWNHKHIVNEYKREHIKKVCQGAGFKPTILYTPIQLMEEIQMKETPEKQVEYDPDTYTNPILEECYRIKREISAEFKTLDELFVYLKAKEEEEKRNGVKYIPYIAPSKHKTPEKSEGDF